MNHFGIRVLSDGTHLAWHWDAQFRGTRRQCIWWLLTHGKLAL